MAAGTVTQTIEAGRNARPVAKVALGWTASGGGAVNGNYTTRIGGTIVRVVFIPSTTAVPTNNYDVTLLDENGVDVLGGQGANLSDTTPTDMAPAMPLTDGVTSGLAPVAIDDILELRVTNAGANGAGQVILYMR